mmetsp:Transcript_62125/g.171843  ORF Transcript_62125/g.171843 Transcript_62125/m.171843 type:complete len:730 (+) Transcript_62125:1758-3947(+)
MRAADGAEVGPPRRDDAVDMVGLGDRTDRHRRDADAVADALGQGRLPHAAVDRLLRLADLAGGHVDQVGARRLEGRGDGNGVFRRGATGHPVVGRDAHRHRPVLRPDGAQRPEDLQRIAQPAVERTAIVVAALVGEGRDEAGQQIAVGAVQFQQVEAGGRRAAGGRDEVLAHPVHVVAGHGLGRGAEAGQVLLRRGRDQRPAARRQRLVVAALPGQAGGALGAGVAELHRHLGAAVGVDEVHDALPGGALRLGPQPRAGRRDARIGRHAGHLGEHQPRAAQRPRAEVGQVPVAGHAVVAAVLRHRRHDDAVLQRQPAQREGREHRRQLRVDARLCREPALEVADVARVAQPQVLVRDALGARQQRVGELLGRQPRMALDVLEPLGRVARRVLDAQHLDTAAGLVVGQRGVDVAGLSLQLAGQRDGVLQRELGARADREMRRVGRIAHQHDRRAALVAVHPGLADHAREAYPLRRAAQMAGVRDQLVAVQHPGKQALAEGDALVLAHRLQACGPPDVFRRLDDEGRMRRVEAVGVRLKPAPLGLLEVEGEGIEQLRRAQPHKAAAAQVDVGLVGGGVLLADAAVQPVGRDDEVGVQARVVGHLGLVDQLNAQLLAARLQDVQQLLAADAAEAMAAGDDAAAADMHRDVIPVVEGVGDLGGRLGVGLAQRVDGLVRQHHAPAEGVARAVALQHAYLVGRVGLLHPQREIQAGGSAADAGDAHELCLSITPL